MPRATAIFLIACCLIPVSRSFALGKGSARHYHAAPWNALPTAPSPIGLNRFPPASPEWISVLQDAGVTVPHPSALVHGLVAQGISLELWKLNPEKRTAWISEVQVILLGELKRISETILAKGREIDPHHLPSEVLEAWRQDLDYIQEVYIPWLPPNKREELQLMVSGARDVVGGHQRFAVREALSRVAKALEQSGATGIETDVLDNAVLAGEPSNRPLPLAKAATPNIGKPSDEEWFNAIAAGSIERVRDMLQREADPNTLNVHGWPSLMYAAIHDRPDVVRLLLQYGADVNATDGSGRTALMMAASHEQSEIVQLLINAGGQIETRNKWMESALFLAARAGKIENVRLLLDKGANPNTKSENLSALMAAVYHGRRDAAKLLLDRGAGIMTQYGNTIPQWAQSHGFDGMVDLFPPAPLEPAKAPRVTALARTSAESPARLPQLVLQEAKTTRRSSPGLLALTIGLPILAAAYFFSALMERRAKTMASSRLRGLLTAGPADSGSAALKDHLWDLPKRYGGTTFSKKDIAQLRSDGMALAEYYATKSPVLDSEAPRLREAIVFVANYAAPVAGVKAVEPVLSDLLSLYRFRGADAALGEDFALLQGLVELSPQWGPRVPLAALEAMEMILENAYAADDDAPEPATGLVNILNDLELPKKWIDLSLRSPHKGLRAQAQKLYGFFRILESQSVQVSSVN